MRKALVLWLAVVCLMFLTLSAYGQFTTGAFKQRVNFDFMVGKTHMPAGEYLFRVDTGRQMLLITNTATNETRSFFTTDLIVLSGPKESKLVFLRDGDQHVLHQVWSRPLGHGHDIVHSSDVVELETK